MLLNTKIEFIEAPIDLLEGFVPFNIFWNGEYGLTEMIPEPIHEFIAWEQLVHVLDAFELFIIGGDEVQNFENVVVDFPYGYFGEIKLHFGCVRDQNVEEFSLDQVVHDFLLLKFLLEGVEIVRKYD